MRKKILQTIMFSRRHRCTQRITSTRKKIEKLLFSKDLTVKGDKPIMAGCSFSSTSLKSIHYIIYLPLNSLKLSKGSMPREPIRKHKSKSNKRRNYKRIIKRLVIHLSTPQLNHKITTPEIQPSHLNIKTVSKRSQFVRYVHNKYLEPINLIITL